MLHSRARRLAVSVVLCALLAPHALVAVEVQGLYEGQVAVASKDEAGRAVAIGEALRQVLSKLTGMPSPGGPLVEAAVAEPQHYLQQFRYRETPQGEFPVALWVRFDRSAVDRLLRDAELPRWSAQRPGILAWVVAATATGEDFVAADDPSGPGAALQRRAWERGLPLSFPLLDLEDRVRVRPSEIWGLDRAGLRDLSARYAPAAVLVGRLEPTGTGAWVGSWRLLDSGQSAEWVSRGLSADATAGAAMDAVADRLAARYALVGPAIAEGSIEIRVSGIRTVDDYARTLAYLQSLDQVSKLALHAARDDEVAFRMQVLGGSEGLRRVASFGGVLAADVAPQAEGALRFRLLP